ncbi:class I SAM-dependent methyltransferase [Brevibacterium salitolerans]|uniref:class I SAM-dependent methyltransferase n=1 Tax=Brevibacterium salitolerans TaxID=1403566 RepID=UPI0031E3EEF8
MTSLPSVPTLPRSLAHALAAALHAASYTPTALRGIWGVDADAALEANDPAPARRACARLLGDSRGTRTAAAGDGAEAGGGAETAGGGETAGESREGRDLAALASVFLLDRPVRRGGLTRALGEELVTGLTEAGLFEEVAAPPTASAASASSAENAPPASPVPPAEARLRSVLALTCHALPVGVPRHLRPGDDTLLLVSDHGTLTTEGPLDGDYVLGHGGAGRTLAEITPRHPVGLAADIGTGCGIQAVLLARHASRVIATDVSRRALACAALTAQLAGVEESVELRHGSLYAPLPETVDLLVSNPPFVITPRTRTGSTSSGSADTESTSSGNAETASTDAVSTEAGTTEAGNAEADEASGVFEYRDGGRTGDAIMHEILEGAPAHLNPDGHAAFLGNWEYGEGRRQPHEWLAAQADAPHPGTTGDSHTAASTSVMVIERQRMSPAEYARTWIRDGGVPRAGARWQADTEAWLDDFEARGVERVGFGWVRLHRLAADAEAAAAPSSVPAPDAVAPDALAPDVPAPGASGQAHAEPASATAPVPVRSFSRIDTGPGSNPAGLASFLDVRLGLLEWLAEADDAELADTAFVLAGDVTEHRHLRPGAEDPTMLTIEQGAGLARTFQADPALAGFLGVCDGSLTLGQTAAALAQLLGADPQALTGQLVGQVRALAPEGVLTPAPA